MKKSITTKPTPQNIAAVVGVLAQVPAVLESMSVALRREELLISIAEGERSFLETLAHLVNCEARTSEAIYLALLAEEPSVPDLHPERRWGKLMRHEQSDFGELLAYFAFRRKVLLRVLAELSEKQWSRVVRQEGKQRRESVYWLARVLAIHEMEHVAELESGLSTWPPPTSDDILVSSGPDSP